MIGSLSPDLAYFLPGELGRVETHSFAGLFWFCWPVSIGLWLLFVRVLEQPTIALLPENWRTRFAPSDQEITLPRAGVRIGRSHPGRGNARALGFVHASGHGGRQRLPALHAVAFHVDGWRIRWFFVLQVSELGGRAHGVGDLGMETAARTLPAPFDTFRYARDAGARARVARRGVTWARDHELLLSFRHVAHSARVPFPDRRNDRAGAGLVRSRGNDPTELESGQ